MSTTQPLEHADSTTSRPKTASARFPVTVIVLTLNEEDNIRTCLANLHWADDVVVLDSHSNDRTVELARKTRPDVRVFRHAFQDFGDQRNWALNQISSLHDWVLFLDADERCNAKCAAAIRRAIETPGDHVGFYLSCRNYFLGRWIRRCTLFPSWQLRLLRRQGVRFRKEGHGQREVTEGPLGYIAEPYDHYGFSKGISQWIERHNQYSTEEVELIERLSRERCRVADLIGADPVRRRRASKILAAKVGFRPLLRFLYLYLVRRGFLDGYPGLIFCLLRVSHEIHLTAKLAEAKLRKKK